MALRIVTADERLSSAVNKTTLALFGASGVGKTTQVKTMPAEKAICIDLEAGLKSVQDWRGDSIPVRCFEDAIDLACLVGGVNPAADPTGFFSEGHYQHLAAAHPDLVRLIASKSIVFLDSITDLTRQAMAWAKTRPEAFSEKTGKPDTRGAYGLMAREVIGLLKHPQMEGGKAARELPGIVDQVVTMGLFSREGDAWRYDPERGTERRFVCRAGNSFGLPAKDRSGRLDETEPADLAALLRKINATSTNQG
jgi:hypothetical protein